MYARANAAVLTSAEIEQCIKSTILGEVIPLQSQDL